jgi:hypothetical protein
LPAFHENQKSVTILTGLSVGSLSWSTCSYTSCKYHPPIYANFSGFPTKIVLYICIFFISCFVTGKVFTILSSHNVEQNAVYNVYLSVLWCLTTNNLL